MGESYLLLKRGLYWRPDAQGYTGVKAEAGRYSLEDALARCHSDGEPVTMMSVREAPKYSPGCTLEAKFDAEAAENARYVEALKFYSERENYHDTPAPNKKWKTALVLFDGGKRARQALGLPMVVRAA